MTYEIQGKQMQTHIHKPLRKSSNFAFYYMIELTQKSTDIQALFIVTLFGFGFGFHKSDRISIFQTNNILSYPQLEKFKPKP